MYKKKMTPKKDEKRKDGLIKRTIKKLLVIK